MSNQLTADLAGADKAALVLLALGSDRSAALLAGLSPEETTRLSEHLSRLADTDGQTRDRVLDEFRQAVGRPPTADLGTPPTPPVENGTKGRSDRAEIRAARVHQPYLARLQRVPPSALASARSEESAAVDVPGDLLVACRAELASLRLAVSALGALAVGDVVLLKPGSDVRVDLVGGRGCRFAGTLREVDGLRAVEILSDARIEEEADDPAASDSTPGK